MTGLIFDLDGTLLDTLEDLLAATNFALRAHGYPERTLRELRGFVGNGAYNQIRLSVPEGQDPLPVLETYQAYYPDHCRIRTRPYDGIGAALEQLRQQYVVAIVSNKPDAAVKNLCGELFPGIYALGEAAPVPRKPAPDMVRKALAAIGADGGICIGDSEVDLLTAKNAGVPCVAVTWGFRDEGDLLAAGAVHLCRSPEELPGIIRRIAGNE